MTLDAHGKGSRSAALSAVALLLIVLFLAPPAVAQRVIASTNPAKMADAIPSAAAASDPSSQPPAASLTAQLAAPAAAEQLTSQASQTMPAAAPVPQTPGPFLGRIEVSQWGNSVSNGFGNWYGGGLHLFLDPSPRLSLLGEVYYEHRPDETEQAGVFGATIHLNKWFYVNLTASGGGPDDPAAFLPRYRYDVTGNLITPIKGFVVTGGWTRLQYGNPVGGRIIRGGFIQYAGKVILQGTVNFNNVRPGNHKSVDGVGSIQIGHEGHYWIGAVGGGGTEAWQTLGLFPFDVQFNGYHFSLFARKWLTRRFGVALQYDYVILQTAYHSSGGEIRFFWQF